MSVVQVLLAALFFGATAISTVLTALVWRRRENAANRWLLLLLGTAAVWSFGALLTYLSDAHVVKFVAVNIQLSAGGFVPTGWVMFALAYTGSGLGADRRLVAALLAEPILVAALGWTSPIHGALYSDIFLAADLNGVGVAWTPLTLWHLAYTYLALLVGALLLLRFVLTAQQLYQWQAAGLLIVLVSPVAVNAAAVFTSLPTDITPIGFVFSGSVLYLTTTRAGATDVVPVARDAVVDIMRDGVFVADTDDRFLDCNQRAAEMLGVRPDAVLGETVYDHLPNDEWHDAYERAKADETVELTVSTDGGDTVLAVRVSPLYGDAGDLLGRVFVVTDITDRKCRERELERQNEQLDAFASLVSHDLRNPLNVAQMRLELLEADDEHVPEIETALSRMDALIDDVLTVAREGQTVEETDPVSLRECAVSAWGTVATEHATLDLADDVTVEADRARLARVFENLFRNAVEHGSTSPDSQARRNAVEHGSTGNRTESDDADGAGSVEPSVADAPEDAVGHGSTGSQPEADDAVEHTETGVTVRVGTLEDGFYVEDDGPGIPEDDREQVFERSFSTAADGTGLGLSIVTSVVEAHGWSITATDGQDGGARFEISGVDTATPVRTDDTS
jgi:PAS domain S-box-containing protein